MTATTALTAPAPRAERRHRQLLVTALYTAGTWAWAGLPGAELFDHRDSRKAFRGINAVVDLARFFGRPASLRHGLVQRHVMIDRAVEDAGTEHVLELAAGLSRRGAHFSRSPGVTYTEVDLPGVIARKRELLADSEAGRAVLGRSNLRMVEGDLATIDLATVGAAPPAAPLTVIAEGLLMYLDGDQQRDLFARVRRLLDGGGVFLFDLVPFVEHPPRFWIERVMGKLKARKSKNLSFTRDTRGRADLVADLRAAGFEVAVLEPAAAPARWQIPHLDRTTLQLVFCAWVPSGDRALVASDVVAASRPDLPATHLPRSSP